MDDIEAVFNRKDMTFEEAVQYFKERVPVTASVFYSIAEKYRGLKVEQTAPEGLMPDPHFSTNPAKVRFEPDLKDYPAPLVKAYQNREKENPGK